MSVHISDLENSELIRKKIQEVIEAAVEPVDAELVDGGIRGSYKQGEAIPPRSDFDIAVLISVNSDNVREIEEAKNSVKYDIKARENEILELCESVEIPYIDPLVSNKQL